MTRSDLELFTALVRELRELGATEVVWGEFSARFASPMTPQAKLSGPVIAEPASDAVDAPHDPRDAYRREVMRRLSR